MGTTATASGTFTSNTGLVKTVMNEVKMATVAKLPYTIEGAAYGAAAGTNGAPADAVKTAVSNKAVIAATRGESTYNTEAGYYSGQLAELGGQVEIAGEDQDTYSKIAFGDTQVATGITNTILESYHRVWDPVIAAQLTEGAMCCNAEYFS